MSKQFTTRDPTTIHIQGVLGECAFAKMCEKQWSDAKDVKTQLENTQSRSAWSDTFDWTVFGKTVDVKTTLFPWSKTIYARAHKFRNPADWYVLILIEFLHNETLQPYRPTSKEYDSYFQTLEKDNRAFRVRTTFRGAIPGDMLFSAAFGNGSFSATPNCTEWEDYCKQLSLVKDLKRVEPQ